MQTINTSCLNLNCLYGWKGKLSFCLPPTTFQHTKSTWTISAMSSGERKSIIKIKQQRKDRVKELLMANRVFLKNQLKCHMEQQKKHVLYFSFYLQFQWGRTSLRTDPQLEKRGTSNDHWGKQAKYSVAHRDFCLCSNTELDYKNPARELQYSKTFLSSERLCSLHITTAVISDILPMLQKCVSITCTTNCTALPLHRIHDVCIKHHNSFPKGILVCKSRARWAASWGRVKRSILNTWSTG